MLQTIKRIAIGASMVVGASAIATAPAMAGSLTGATIGGTAASDYYVYGVSGNQTVKIENPTQADIQNVLGGNAGTPTGNVELRASTEKSTFTAADFTKNTSLTGNIGGKSITLSSLTASDWASNAGGGLTLGQKWFGEALTANNVSLNATQRAGLFSIFTNYGGFQRFSDPNISYVNQDDTTGLISIGLAGHLNATSLIVASVNSYLADPNVPSANKILASSLVSVLSNKNIKASELVKVSYDGGPAQYLYNFTATNSGLVNTDGFSHNGNYEVSLQGAKVPEPSTMLGLMAVGGLFAATKRKSQKTA